MPLENTITLAAPPEKVFDLLADLDRQKEWMAGWTALERLTPGPLVVGSRFRQTREVSGRAATEHFEVVELERPHRLGLFVDGKKGTSGRGEFRFRYELAPDGAGTRLTMRGDVRILGIVGKILIALFAGFLRKSLQKDLDAFKAFVERA